MKQGLDKLMKALKADLFGNGEKQAPDDITADLLNTLRKLKLSDFVWGGPLRMEGLDATLKNVTYDSKDLKLWKDIKKDDK